MTIGYGTSTTNVQALATAAAPFNTLADKFGNGVAQRVRQPGGYLQLHGAEHRHGHRGQPDLLEDGPGRTAAAILRPTEPRASPRRSPACSRCPGAGRPRIVFGAIYGALDFASWLSYFATLFFIAAYLLISVGLIRFMWRDYRPEFSWIRHAVLPVISIVAMIWVLWGNIHPYPPAPLRWFIYATVGVLLISALIAQWLATGRPDAMRRAGQLLGDIERTSRSARRVGIARQGSARSRCDR